jgi:hypothetical protein
MALILAAIVFVLTLAYCGLVLFADGMSDAPSVQGISPWPGFITGMIIVGVLILVHFVGV